MICKKVTLVAVCEKCGKTLEARGEKGYGQDKMIDYARLHGWCISDRKRTVFCPECRETIPWGKSRKGGNGNG